MAEHAHKNGEMDIHEQEATFNGFVKFLTNAVIVLLLFLVFLAIFAR